jgi:hypothetical protein
LLNSGREEETLRWATFASAVYPDEVRWQEFFTAAVNNRLQRLVRSNQIAQARAFLDEHGASLTPENYADLDSVLFDTELLTRANGIRSAQDGDNLIATLVDARSNGRIDNRRSDELLTFTVQRTASVLSSPPSRDWLAAINYIEAAIERFGSNREWEQSLQTFRNNRATEFHNRFAAAWNRRNFEEAQLILDEGLAEFPTNRQLLTNQETVNRQMAQSGAR